MKRITWVIAAGVLFVGAGVAVGHGFTSKSIKQVSATFTASTPSNLRTSTCTATDGSYTKSTGTYAGTATSTEAALNGPVAIEATSLVNTTSGVGVVSGYAKITTATGGRTSIRFDGVLTEGTVVGIAEGHSRGDGDVKVFGNISAKYVAATGFTEGKLGDAASGDAVLITQSGGCNASTTTRPDNVTARGAISAITPAAPAPPTSITVAGVTCTVPATLQSAVAALKVGGVTTIEL